MSLFYLFGFSQGLIFGFIGKAAAQEILEGKPIGTFLVRFSERSAGLFAVAYVAKGETKGESVVKHFLVPQSTKKLSDFLRPKDSFKSVLLCNTDFAVESYRAMVKGTMNKDGAFAEFYSVNDGAPLLEGYDDLNDE